MLTDKTVRKWKRDALEMNFNLQKSIANNHNATVSAQLGSQLCNKIAMLCYMLEGEEYEIREGSNGGESRDYQPK